MKGFLLDILGRTALGSIWTTAIGGGAIWFTAEKVMHMLAQGSTVGELVATSEFHELAMGVMAIFLRDPEKLPQPFYRDE